MNNLKIGIRLTIAFSVAIIAIGILGMLSYTSIRQLNDGQDSIYICGLSLSAISDIDSRLRDVNGDVGIIVNEYFNLEIDQRLQDINEYFDDMETLISTYEGYLNGNAEDTANLAVLKNAVSAFEASVLEIENVVKSGDYEKAADFMENGDYSTCNKEVYSAINVMLKWNVAQMDMTAEKGTATYNSSIRLILTIIIIAVIASVLFAVFITIGITSGITQMQKLAREIAGGNLKVEFKDKLLKRRDEVGKLSSALNVMKNNMHSIISQIVISSKSLTDMANTSTNEFKELNNHIQEISASTEELSAGMEETAASSEELNAAAVEIDNAVEIVALKSVDGAKMAGDISTRAASLKDTFTASKDHMDTTFVKIQAGLLKSLDDAKGVKQINTLADAILDITSQTNLLSLNAAIEAARAGDAGKGFAVVADEIRSLAENSKGTATQILEIASVVIKSVDLLIEDANKLLTFVEKDVRTDYTTMLSAADAYSGDAASINDMTMDISATAEELQASIQAVVSTIDEVSRAANEGASTTTSIAERISEITVNADTVLKNLVVTKDTASDLNDAVSGFTI